MALNPFLARAEALPYARGEVPGLPRAAFLDHEQDYSLVHSIPVLLE
jgi:hypothetical protein